MTASFQELHKVWRIMADYISALFPPPSLMNIAPPLTPAQAGDTGPTGATLRQEYSVAVAVKTRDAILQEGAAIEQLIASAPLPPDPDSPIGKHLNALA